MKAQDLFEKVTADLIVAIEAGASNWRMPWHTIGAGVPRSVDGREYRGWNRLVLSLSGHSSATFATFARWSKMDCRVRRGEHGTQVVIWKQTDRTVTDDDASEERRRSLFARAFTVFAAEQVEGGERFIPQPVDRTEPERVADADRYFAAIGADVRVGGDRACYVPSTDAIHLPELARFDRAADYYSTAAHEHAHWSGPRLGRDLTGRFGSAAYGSEELVAELTAAFWGAQFGIDQATREDHARYIGDWISLLRKDARALVAASGHAQRALDYLNTAAGLGVAAEDPTDE